MTVVYDRETLLGLKPKDFVVNINPPRRDSAQRDSNPASGGVEHLGKVRYGFRFMENARLWPLSSQAPPDVPPAFRKLIQQPQLQHHQPPRRQSSNQQMQMQQPPRGRGRGRPSQHNVHSHQNQNQPGWGAPTHANPSGLLPTPRVTVITIPKKEIKLHKAENSWKPDFNHNRVPDTNRAQQDDAAMTKIANGILNKITPKTFDKLSAKLLLCGITTETRMIAVLDLVFAKALDQEFFGELYAQICQRLEGLEALTADGERMNFRNILIAKCTEQFKKVTDTTAVSDVNEADLSEADLGLLRNKTKRHLMGYMKLIGELFKVGVVVPKTVQVCVEKLLELCQVDEEYAECCCKLLMTVGPAIDLNPASPPKAKSSMNTWFGLLETKKMLSNISLRVKMAIENLIDIRLNKWRGHSKSGELKVIQKDLPPIEVQTPPTTTTTTPPTTTTTQDPNELSPEKLERKLQNTMKEYLSSNDRKEALKCAAEFKVMGVVTNFLDLLLTEFIDCKDADRKALLGLLLELSTVLAPPQFDVAISKQFEFLDDLLIDVPQAATHIAELIAKAFLRGICSLDLFQKEFFNNLVCKPQVFSSTIVNMNTVAESGVEAKTILQLTINVVKLAKTSLKNSDLEKMKTLSLKKNPNFSTLF